MDNKNKEIFYISVRFAKGKEHLRTVLRVTEGVMTIRPNMLANVEIYANPDRPDKLSCSLDKDFTYDELKELIEDILNKCDAWSYFE